MTNDHHHNITLSEGIWVMKTFTWYTWRKMFRNEHHYRTWASLQVVQEMHCPQIQTPSGGLVGAGVRQYVWYARSQSSQNTRSSSSFLRDWVHTSHTCQAGVTVKYKDKRAKGSVFVGQSVSQLGIILSLNFFSSPLIHFCLSSFLVSQRFTPLIL